MSPIFFRKRTMCTSTVRVLGRDSGSHAMLISSRRQCTRPEWVKQAVWVRHQGRMVHEADRFLLKCLGTLYGDAWTAGISMTPDEAASQKKAALRWKRIAWTSDGVLVGLSGLGLLLFLQSRYHERLEADRLASLTHSLKTPLAILKLRCDTARNTAESRRSQGLGLFLLAQLAEREGWGLLFQSEPGVGFSVVVEIRQ